MKTTRSSSTFVTLPQITEKVARTIGTTSQATIAIAPSTNIFVAKTETAAPILTKSILKDSTTASETTITLSTTAVTPLSVTATSPLTAIASQTPPDIFAGATKISGTTQLTAPSVLITGSSITRGVPITTETVPSAHVTTESTTNLAEKVSTSISVREESIVTTSKPSATKTVTAPEAIVTSATKELILTSITASVSETVKTAPSTAIASVTTTNSPTTAATAQITTTRDLVLENQFLRQRLKELFEILRKLGIV